MNKLVRSRGTKKLNCRNATNLIGQRGTHQWSHICSPITSNTLLYATCPHASITSTGVYLPFLSYWFKSYGGTPTHNVMMLMLMPLKFQSLFSELYLRSLCFVATCHIILCCQASYQVGLSTQLLFSQSTRERLSNFCQIYQAAFKMQQTTTLIPYLEYFCQHFKHCHEISW